MADLADLPFKEKSFEGILASHCLYHVDKNIQLPVLKELYRVTKPNKNIVIFYSSNLNLVSVVQRVGKTLIKLLEFLLRLLSYDLMDRGPGMKMLPPLYFYTYNPFWLTKEFNSVDISCLRTLTKYETVLFGKLHLLKLIIPVLSFLERTFPRGMLCIGKYLTIRIQRRE